MTNHPNKGTWVEGHWRYNNDGSKSWVKGHYRKPALMRLPNWGKQLTPRQKLNRKIKFIDADLKQLRGWQNSNPTEEKKLKIDDLTNKKNKLIEDYNKSRFEIIS